MVFPDISKNRTRDLIYADLGNGRLGTGTLAPLASDTALQAPDTGTDALLTKTKGNKLIKTTHILLSTVGNGTSYAEFGPLGNNNITIMGRVVFPSFAKNNSVELQTSYLLRIV